MNKFDILAIGDTTVDVFLTVDPHDAQAVCSLDEVECKISFAYGAKVPVSSMARIPGVGNAANLAVGSARLGLNSGIYTVLGSDKDSQDNKQVFLDENVSTELVYLENGAKSNFSAVLNYSAERTIFVYHEPRKYNLPEFDATWIYLTSVGKDHEELHEQTVEHLKQKRMGKLAFNPGSYQLLDGLEKLKPILEKTNVLFVNREEAQRLTGGDAEDVKGLMGDLKSAGPEIVVITDGPGGSYASYDGREVWHLGIPETKVVERTGAGDAYSTGFLTAVMGEKSLVDAMVWGTMNATSVLGYVGAREGLLTSNQMKEWMGKYGSQLKPRMI